MSEEDPVAKAKAIAAKLAATSAPPGIPSDPTASTKRKRWATDDSAGGGGGGGTGTAAPGIYGPASTTGGSGGTALGGDDHKRLRSEAVKKVWIPNSNPGYNYVGLLIGPGGSKQKALQQEAGGRVKIAIRGKGSNGTHNSNLTAEQRAMEEPLHVLLEGDADCVDKAERLVRELIEDSDKADAEKNRQLAAIGVPAPTPTAASTAASPGKTGVSHYTPTPVAQLIGAAMGGAGAMNTPGLGLHSQLQTNSAVGGETVEEAMGIPNGVVGYIIGRGGESITSMQRRTGCRVQIQKEHEMAPGTNTRIITLTSTDRTSIAACREIIEGMVAERQKLNQMQQHGGGGAMQSGADKVQLALQQGQQLVTVQVPDADVGLVIGKGGMNIRSMQDRTGANIQIPQSADPDNPLIRTCSITHPTMDGAVMAKGLVEEILRSKTNTMGAGGINESSVEVQIPDKDVGMII
eukprot:CAMPEP_0195512456 /NCGR_PEP_ID=MMETSP0794_2-20130614/4406_1 /TAXON_ID=515487 /ORGANISM="Stephanopyxis turris, Strain CCMP 815" /LENGTH=462 /DNA_ID=CAMNT_0040640245 /DNA_START=94 /DNA_END=1479 /DNA_ORIENTATION=+